MLQFQTIGNILALVAKILHYISAVILLILHNHQIVNDYSRCPRKCPTWFSRIILLMQGSFNVWWTSRKRCSMPTGFVPLGEGLSTLTLIVFMVNTTQSESKNNRLLEKVLNKIGKGGVQWDVNVNNLKEEKTVYVSHCLSHWAI